MNTFPCQHCNDRTLTSATSGKVVRVGHYLRKSDSALIQKFHCIQGKHYFSSASNDPRFKQKKRHLNPIIFKLLCAGVSHREIGRLLSIKFLTVDRKRRYLSQRALLWSKEFLKNKDPVGKMQFDDMETFEHSKLKPLSITLAVEKGSRLILGFRVASMPAKGLLVKRALKKYGPRPDHRSKARAHLFKDLREHLRENVHIESDQNPHYEPAVKRHFPKALYQTFKGRRGCVVGQGELKSGGFDPLFSLNHTCAMLRANINRLFRRTWCTTKKPENLTEHLWIYAQSHNQRIWKKVKNQNPNFNKLTLGWVI